MPTDRRVLFGHHFAAIAGAGPLVGPVLATQMGYLPGTIWIIVGAVFAGCVQDYLVLSISMRRRGRSLGQMARDELGAVGGTAAIVGVLVIMVILLAVLALVVVNALAESPWGVFSIAMTIPIALFMGLYLRFLRPGRVSEVSLIGVVLLLLAVVSGGWVAGTDWGTDWFTLSKVTLSWCIIIYGFAASVLPVWLLLAPRDYLSTFMKVGTIALLAVGILLARPVMEAPAISQFATERHRPGVRRLAVPVPVHHDRLRRAVGLPRADLLGHHAEAAGEGKPDAADRLRRHAHRVVRRDHGADHRRDPQPAPVLRDERTRRRRPAAPPRPRPSTSTAWACPARRSPPAQITDGRRERRRGVDHLAHRRRADAGVRHVRGAAPGLRRRRR